MKKETLEEVAERYAELSYYNRDDVNAFVNGAKWQSERMYSKEEIKEAYWNRTDEIDVDGYWINDPEKDLEGLLKELKKIPMTFVPDERMYSEEDMISFAEFVATYTDKNRNVHGQMLHAKSKYDGAERTIDLLNIWFEQFKKK